MDRQYKPEPGPEPAPGPLSGARPTVRPAVRRAVRRGLCGWLAAAGSSGALALAALALPVLAPAERGDRVLVVAPHIDDEAIAAAGYAAEALARGAEVYVVYMTAGDCNRFAAALLEHTFRPRAQSLLHEGEARIREGRLAMAELGVPADHVFLLGYPDQGLRAMRDNPGSVIPSRGTGRTAVPYPQAISPGAFYTLSNLEADLARVIAIAKPTTVIAPVPFDRHPDHAATGLLVRDQVSRLRPQPRLLGYLVHSAHYPRPLAYAPGLRLLPPARFAGEEWRAYPLSKDGERRKVKLLAFYRSQKKDPYLRFLLDAFVRENELYVEGGGKELTYARAKAPKVPAAPPAH